MHLGLHDIIQEWKGRTKTKWEVANEGRESTGHQMYKISYSKKWNS